jgi:beta-N-acetylhexosaminidase
MRWISFSAFLIISLIWSLIGGGLQAGLAQVDPATEIFERLSPEERVGQLFLVAFQGNTVDVDDPIYDLIVNYHISGVILSKENDNFIDPPETLESLSDLISSLQEAEFQSSLDFASSRPSVDEFEQTTYIPLLIATPHEPGGNRFSEILSGLTELPTQMAIGATWDTSLAFAVGEVLGRELNALGINLILGPSLDVLEEPRLVEEGGLGVRSFGGDPYWVGVMGRSYIAGLHAGSQNRLAVASKHFPGLGSADRSIEEEIATVRKSLEQLKQIELAPFFQVTDLEPGTDNGVTDGLLTSHIRYQGLQGNVRETTRPISFDPQAYAQLMALEELAVWRAGDGLTVSDSLGTRAVRRFRDPTERTFKAHLVARDAFLAGNDLLILSDFQSPDYENETTTILSTLEFFANKYEEDTAFAQRVDESVMRILRLKLRLFGNVFALAQVNPSGGSLEDVGISSDLTAQIARAAASLISPPQDEIQERLGGPPLFGERIVFFTDVRRTRQCSSCASQSNMEIDALEETVLRFYGQAAAGEVGSWNLQSYTMADLAHYLGEPLPPILTTPLTPRDQLEDPLLSAQWVVFSILDGTESVYGSNALKLFLDQRPDLARNKHVVVFAHDVPYGLDATEFSKVDAFYALYGSGAEFLEVAAHLLFLEHAAPGSPPVSIPGIGYDLRGALFPNPDQILSLFLSKANGEGTEEEPLTFSIGDQVTIETGVILDANLHPVPDETIVEFLVSYPGEGIESEVEATTVDGMAMLSFTLDRQGMLAISARSDPARLSETLQLNVQEGVPAVATVISPLLTSTTTPDPTNTPPAPTPTVTFTVDDQEPVESSSPVGPFDLLMGMIGVVSAGILGYVSHDRSQGSSNTSIKFILLPVIGGLVGYNYVAWMFPGSATLLEFLGSWAGLFSAFALGLVGLIVARVWSDEINSVNEK